MKYWQFTRVRSRFVLWFLLVALLPLILVSVILYHQRVQAIKIREFQKLVAIRDLKTDRIIAWLQEREGDVRTMAGDPELRTLETQANGELSLTRDMTDIRLARELLLRYLHNYHAFFEIFFIHRTSGRILLSTTLAHEGLEVTRTPYFIVPLETQKLFIQDIYYSEMDRTLTMAFSLPVFGLHNPKQIIGVLVAKIDLQNTLYSLLLNRTGMGDSGETLIVNQDLMALNNLRWHNQAPLQLQITATAAVLAAQGKTGIIETTDYRGKPVLAAYTYLPDMQWGLVAKQDLAELYEPIAFMLWQMVFLLGAASLVVIVIALILTKNISEPIITLNTISQKIADGNLSLRFPVQRKDELGALSRSLNKMTTALESRAELQQRSLDFSTFMMSADDVSEFRASLTRFLVEKTRSCLGVYYLLDPADRVFHPVFSLGAQRDRLRSFSADRFEGEWGHVLARKELSHITGLSERTQFIFITTAGDMRPSELLSIPIILDHTVEAIISLATLHEYTPMDLEFLKQNWFSVNTKFMSLHAVEHIKSLAQELHVKNRELKVQAEELQEQSRELEHQNIELAEKNRQIQEANRLKSEFLSNMSHELRTPLNSVIALSHVLLLQGSGRLSSEECHYLEIIERNGKHLLSLINDVLDLSKIEAGKIDIRLSLFSLRELIDSVKETLLPLVGEKDVELHVNIADDFPPLMSDQAKLRHILQNLVGNAIKFTDQGRIEIKATYTDASCELVIQDTGIGISSDDLPHIFEAFRQVDGSTSRRYEGAGLGLSIVARYVSLLEGTISVESALNQGTTFTLNFPLSVRHLMSPQSVAEHSSLTDDDSSEAHSDVPPQCSMASLLFVEDSEPAILQIRAVLERAGYHLTIARNGKEALEYVSDHIPDGIILDLMMPEIDGFEVLERIRSRPEIAHIPILILTAKDLTQQDLKRLSSNHVQQLIQKGDVNPEELLRKIQLMLNLCS